MDYGKLLGRAFTILRERPFLIILGILSSFSGSGSSWRTGGGGSGNGSAPGADGQGFQFQPPDGFADGIGAMSIGLIILIAIVVFLLILVFWIVGVVAQGGLVNPARFSDCR